MDSHHAAPDFGPRHGCSPLRPSWHPSCSSPSNSPHRCQCHSPPTALHDPTSYHLSCDMTRQQSSTSDSHGCLKLKQQNHLIHDQRSLMVAESFPFLFELSGKHAQNISKSLARTRFSPHPSPVLTMAHSWPRMPPL